ncbi:MAG: hypothetical protein KAG97_12190 [Victivallales bacterium]|nr:hypothetical protein [Victivallales bacterium]
MTIKREFSWSLSRGAMFRRCPRAYYHHYYGSWGGWRSDADLNAVETHALKKLVSVDFFADSLFRDAFSLLLFERRRKPEQFISELRRRSMTAAGRRIRELRGTQSPNISNGADFIERHYHGMNCDELRSVITMRLDTLSANLAESPALPLLAAVPYLSFIQFKKPASFTFEGVTIWTVPDYLWNDSGSIKGVNLFSYNPVDSGAWSRKAAIDAMFAESLRPGAHVRVESAFLHLPSFPIIAYSAPRTEMRCEIKRDVDDMLAVTNIDTDIREERFVQTDNEAICESCPFQDLC